MHIIKKIVIIILIGFITFLLNKKIIDRKFWQLFFILVIFTFLYPYILYFYSSIFINKSPIFFFYSYSKFVISVDTFLNNLLDVYIIRIAIGFCLEVGIYISVEGKRRKLLYGLFSGILIVFLNVLSGELSQLLGESSVFDIFNEIIYILIGIIIGWFLGVLINRIFYRKKRNICCLKDITKNLKKRLFVKLLSFFIFLILIFWGAFDVMHRRTSEQPMSFSGITYGNNKFVTITFLGKILTSQNGINWIPRTLGISNIFVNIIYINGKFVAVGANGIILTSSDGKIWSILNSGTTNVLSGITYGDNTFVAVGYNVKYHGKIITSSNIFTWTKRTSGITNELVGITYGNGTFVAVGDNGIILTSIDGIIWTPRISRTIYSFDSITYLNNEFVTVGDNGTILTSIDGIHWKRQNSGTSNNLFGITYGNGTFVVVGGSGTILTSLDGKKWAKVISETSEPIYAITYGNRKFVAVGNNGTILTSPDGKIWTLHHIYR